VFEGVDVRWRESSGGYLLNGYGPLDDFDYFKIFMYKGDTIFIDLSQGSPVVRLFDHNQNELVEDTDGEFKYYTETKGWKYLQIDPNGGTHYYLLLITIFSEPDVWFENVSYETIDADNNQDKETISIDFHICSNVTETFDIWIFVTGNSNDISEVRNQLSVTEGSNNGNIELNAMKTGTFDFTLKINYGNINHVKDEYAIPDVDLSAPDFWIVVKMREYVVEDGADAWGEADVYYKILLLENDIEDGEGYYYRSDPIDNQDSGDFYGNIKFNIKNDIQMIEIIIGLWDSDGGSLDDIIDIDGKHCGDDDEYQWLDIVYNLEDDTWSGDDTDGNTDGNDDISDDLDAELNYDIVIERRG